MGWIIIIKNVKATKEFLENCDDEFLPMIQGDGASQQLGCDIRDMIEAKKLYTADIEYNWVKEVSNSSQR